MDRFVIRQAAQSVISWIAVCLWFALATVMLGSMLVAALVGPFVGGG